MFYVAIVVSKVLTYLLLRLGYSASTWPGHIALKIYPAFFSSTVSTKKCKIVYIVGTNGKSTTRSLVSHLLRKNGKRVIENKEGANLLNGLVSTLVRSLTLKGDLNYDYCVFEVDENTLPIALSQSRPEMIVFLNLFRDQLDRYGEVNTIAKRWEEALADNNCEAELIINADDPLIEHLGKTSKKSSRYCLPKKLYEKKNLDHDVDSIFCPECNSALVYNKISYSHLGDFRCSSCSFKKSSKSCFCDFDDSYPLLGVYNIYNTNAALLAVSQLLSEKPSSLKKYLKGFEAEFGRGESFVYNNTRFCILLSKNPAGFNQSLRVVQESSVDNPVFLLLNDNYADGRDVSWIWDVEFDDLVFSKRKIVLSGTRVWDLAIRLHYSLPTNGHRTRFESFENTKDALKHLLDMNTGNRTVYVLATYTAMLDVRKQLTGKKFL